MTTHNLIFHSRPRADADWTCPRSRYYAYDFLGGIQKDNLTIDLFIGTSVHDAVAAIATQFKESGKVDIDNIAILTRENVFSTLADYLKKEQDGELFSREQGALVEGLIRAYYKTTWTNLIKQYPTIVGIEKEMIYPFDLGIEPYTVEGVAPHGNPAYYDGKLIFMCKPDLVLEGDDGLIYVEFKTSSSKKEEWIQQWGTSIQVHGTMKAIEYTLNKPIVGAIVQGLYKGYYNYGKFSSQLVYGYSYTKPANPPFTKSSVVYSEDYKAGYKRTPVWEMDFASKGWIDKLSQEAISENLPQTPIIFPRWDLAEAFFRQRAIREKKLLQVLPILDDPACEPSLKQDLLDEFYPQSFKSCKPGYGSGCSYYTICHANITDPLSNGYILKNRDHELPYHDLAAEMLDAKS